MKRNENAPWKSQGRARGRLTPSLDSVAQTLQKRKQSLEKLRENGVLGGGEARLV